MFNKMEIRNLGLALIRAWAVWAALLCVAPAIAGEKPKAEESPQPPEITIIPNYHLVGWANAFLPGSGQMIMGNYTLGLAQSAFELGTFFWGYSLSKLSPLSLDGVPEELPTFSRKSRLGQANINQAVYADMLQEIGIKTHFVNTFTAYREAAKNDPEMSKRIDQRSLWDMFTSPLSLSAFEDPWVYVPTGLLAIETTLVYFLDKNTLGRGAPLTPYSNFLYGLNYGAIQPFGSGAPEEMFYRGFLQNELLELVDSPYFAIPISSAAFAFSHQAGNGRLTAAVAGGYLGYLAYRYPGNLAPGITVHFWGAIMLGIQTILLNSDAQKSTPLGSTLVQINF